MSKPVGGLEMAEYLHARLGKDGMALLIISMLPKFPGNEQAVMALVYAAIEKGDKSHLALIIDGLRRNIASDPAMQRLALSTLWQMADVSDPAAYLEHFPAVFRSEETAQLEPVAAGTEPVSSPFDSGEFDEIR